MDRYFNTVKKVMGTIFGILGTVFFVISIIIIFSQQEIKKNYNTVDGILGYDYITDDDGFIDRNDNFVVHYAIGDDYYHQKINTNMSTWYEGKKVTVYYNPDDPTDIHVAEGMWIIWFIFMIVGYSFISVAGALVFVDLLNKKKIQRILKTAKRSTAKVVGLSMNRMVSFNNRYVQNVMCEITIQGVMKTLKSEGIIDPALIKKIEETKNLIVDVYYVDDKNYFVNLSTIRVSDDSYSVDFS